MFRVRIREPYVHTRQDASRKSKIPLGELISKVNLKIDRKFQIKFFEKRILFYSIFEIIINRCERFCTSSAISLRMGVVRNGSLYQSSTALVKSGK